MEYVKNISLTSCWTCHGPETAYKQLFKPTCYNWIVALDPASYGIRYDTDGYGVEWCNTETCLNHHRFHAENLAQKLAAKCSKRMGTTLHFLDRLRYAGSVFKRIG